MNLKTLLNPSLLILVGVTVVAIWIWRRGAGGVASDTSKNAVKIAGGLVEGVVLGVSEVVGIPNTNESRCAEDVANGRTWASTFSCPAGAFIRGLFGLSLPAKTNPNYVLGTQRSKAVGNMHRMASRNNNRPIDGPIP